LNNLKGYDGWFTENYGAEQPDLKKPFQRKNTQKLDAIRDEIDNLNLDWKDKCVLLTSLIYALDSVDSTLGHYVAYLSDWSPRSYNDLNLKLPGRFEITSQNSIVRGDIFNTISKTNLILCTLIPLMVRITKKCRQAGFDMPRIIIFGQPLS